MVNRCLWSYRERYNRCSITLIKPSPQEDKMKIMKNIVCVVDMDGKPQNPIINKNGIVRRMIEDGEVEIFLRQPLLTIKITKLTKRTRSLIYRKKQTMTLGVDSGYKGVGFSIISQDIELVGGTLNLRNDIKELLEDRARYRNLRRGRLRFRKPRFDHRKNKKEGWLPPSIRHKIDSQKKLINSLTKILPITNIIIETANFDIQKLKNPSIEGKEYQQGARFGIDGNLREYILQRDNYSCMHKECKKEESVKNIHHIVYRRDGGTDSPDNLITLCIQCHTPANHENGYLSPKRILGNRKLSKSFVSETFMNIIRKFMLNEITKENPLVHVEETFGYITKENRMLANDEGLDDTDKTHHNDAFFIAGGYNQIRTKSINVEFLRRNNRCLETFRDAKYIDSRDGKTKSGQVLSSQRTTRSKKNKPENLRKFRTPIIDEKKNKRKEITKGKRSIRTERYEIQKGTIAIIEKDYKNLKSGQIITLGGTSNEGKYAYVLNSSGGFIKSINSNGNMSKLIIPTNICKILKNKKGITFTYQ